MIWIGGCPRESALIDDLVDVTADVFVVVAEFIDVVFDFV